MHGKMMSLLNNAIKDHPGLHSFAALFDDFNEHLKNKKNCTVQSVISQPIRIDG